MAKVAVMQVWGAEATLLAKTHFAGAVVRTVSIGTTTVLVHLAPVVGKAAPLVAAPEEHLAAVAAPSVATDNPLVPLVVFAGVTHMVAEAVAAISTTTALVTEAKAKVGGAQAYRGGGAQATSLPR